MSTRPFTLHDVDSIVDLMQETFKVPPFPEGDGGYICITNRMTLYLLSGRRPGKGLEDRWFRRKLRRHINLQCLRAKRRYKIIQLMETLDRQETKFRRLHGV